METLAQFLTTALVEERPHAFAERLGAPDWRYTSSSRMRERARAIAAGIRDAGLERGDRVALISENRVDWLAADFGIIAAGCVVVPVFASLALDQLDYILRDSGAKLAFVETSADSARLHAACPNAPRCIAFDGSGVDSLSTFEAHGAAAADANPEAVAAFTAGIEAHELAVLIYTSGTTGNPKGVMLSHRNLVSNALAASDVLPARVKNARGTILSVLPFAHIYEHTDVLGFVSNQADLHVTQPDFLLDDLKSARPIVMALVPRIFERVLAGILGKAKAEGGVRARLVPWALEAARAFAAERARGAKPGPALALPYAVAQRLVLSKIKPAIGLDRLEFFVSGSAPLHRDIALTFAGIGVPIAEGYGLTETSPVVTANPPDTIRYGTVGKPIADVQVRIAGDGEILVKGPNVMQGYYHLPAEQPFTEDGWFKTGDIGELDADGYLTITDRKKELIKTSAGKYIAPGRVESALKRSMYVGQCFVIGDGRPFPLALVCPNWDLVRRDFSIATEVPDAAISQRSDVREFMTREVTQKTADLATFEQVRRVALLPRDLTIENGELSPTLKVKRRVVEAKFAELIDAAYAGSRA